MNRRLERIEKKVAAAGLTECSHGWDIRYRNEGEPRNAIRKTCETCGLPQRVIEVEYVDIEVADSATSLLLRSDTPGA